ncbi:MAG TPA: TM0106 family RecB-like putative nuclease [Candidatus Methylomirabilis sp.]|nr:TM0106 family RecB-like putative nuclease [Candidatus Methylomirabilis sp.]
MKTIGNVIRLAATDLSNHLACRHLTTLDLQVVRGLRKEPEWADPDLKVIQELGRRFEERYLAHLESLAADGGARKPTVVNLRAIKDEARALQETLALMQQGVDVIAQGALGNQAWFGRPDVLRRVPPPQQTAQAAGGVFARAARVEVAAPRKWAWSYEVLDTKLTRQTKATTILQLSLYSELLKEAQGVAPEFLWVVTPAPGEQFTEEQHRVSDYAAYYAYVKKRLIGTIEGDAEPSEARRTAAAQFAFAFEAQAAANETTYPEPVEHCQVCRWFPVCDTRRREDDHLSLVAGIRRQQRDQFVEWNAETMAKVAAVPVPLQEKPRHGSKTGYEKVCDQARVQVAGRTAGSIVHERLKVARGTGLCRLPEPSAGDMFVDLEGDPFAGESQAAGGREYLFGFVAAGDGHAKLCYEKRWALAPEDEKAGFEWLVDEIMRRWKAFPATHVYHFGVYEPAAFKRLMGRYATREDEVDSMLRAGLFVDLHTILKQAVRAGVEEYSLKKLEALYAFQRNTPPDESRAAMRYIEHRLELGWAGEDLPEKFRASMEAYNGEDCFSTAAMRDWLETERQEKLKEGCEILRPAPGDGAPPEQVDERQKRVAALTKELKDGISENPAQRTPDAQARWLLADLLDWHRREDKAVWWEYYRLRDLTDEELLEERSALAGLKQEGRVRMQGRLPVERYSFPKQETDIRRGDKLCRGELNIGTVERIEVGERLIEIKRTGKTAALHPSSVFVDARGPKWEVLADSIFKLGEQVTKRRADPCARNTAPWDLLLKNKPRLRASETIAAIGAETTVETACRVASALVGSVFAIQGPPGAGKTFTAARMICRLVQAGKRVGVTAHSHRAIGKLLQEIQVAADEAEIVVRCIRKISEEAFDDEIRSVEITDDNAVPLERLRSGAAQVAAGTAWMWARPEYAGAIHALFIDEAGQMALADVVAAAHSAANLVLIGDPQQLQRPLKGCHPEGAEKSALQHLIGDRKTILPETGMLLPQTRRMHPKVCRFTSEIFYERKLSSHPVTRPFVLAGHPLFPEPGLYFVPVFHEGNQNSSSEEVDVVARIVESLRKPAVKWFYGEGNSRSLKLEEDILIVAPYNAQVSDLTEALPGMKIGTVDKFQGQEAAVVIYSMTTSSPEEAPRGMEFLYSLNRLNVATSRAKTAVILVGSPKLFEPECRTPRQMQLANALCAYREIATEIDMDLI